MKKPRKNSKGDPNKSNTRDQCQTPNYAINPLLKYLDSSWIIWEPARGKGYLEMAFQEKGFKVVSGDILTGQNYFHYDRPLGDIEITNPPYNTKPKIKWVKHTYQLGKLGMRWALLMQDTTLSMTELQPWFDEFGIEIIIPDARIDFEMPLQGFRNSSAQFMTYWFTCGLNIGRQITFAKLHKPPKPELELLYDRYEALSLGQEQLSLGLFQQELFRESVS